MVKYFGLVFLIGTPVFNPETIVFTEKWIIIIPQTWIIKNVLSLRKKCSIMILDIENICY